MDNIVIDSKCVSFYLHSGRALSRRRAAALVRFALSAAGLRQWGRMSIEVFSGSGGTLVIAAPAPGEHIFIPDYALPFFNGLFTE